MYVAAATSPKPRSSAPVSDKVCIATSDADKWRHECNWCRCLGGKSACTRKMCSVGECAQRSAHVAASDSPMWYLVIRPCGS